MEAEWFAQIDSKTMGPLPAKELKELAKSGTLKPMDLVRRGAKGRWMRAKQLNGLFPKQNTGDSLLDVSLRTVMQSFAKGKGRAPGQSAELTEQSFFDVSLRELMQRRKEAPPKPISSGSSEGARKPSSAAPRPPARGAEAAKSKASKEAAQVAKAENAEESNDGFLKFVETQQQAKPSGEENSAAPAPVPTPSNPKTNLLLAAIGGGTVVLLIVGAVFFLIGGGKEPALTPQAQANAPTPTVTKDQPPAKTETTPTTGTTDVAVTAPPTPPMPTDPATTKDAKEPTPPADAKPVEVAKVDGPPAYDPTTPPSRVRPKEPALVHTFEGHSRQIEAVAFSPDFRVMASGDRDGIVRLWSMPQLQPIRSLTGHAGPIRAIAFSPDARRLATGSEDKSIRIWDANSGNLIKTYLGQAEPVRMLSFTAPGHQILSGGAGKSVKLWNANTATDVRSLPLNQTVRAISVASSGEFALIAEGNDDNDAFGVWLWDLRVGKPVYEFVGHDRPVVALKFFANQRYAMSADSRSIRIWCLLTGSEVKRYEFSAGYIAGADLLADGNYALIYGSDSLIRLFDLGTGKDAFVCSGATDTLTCLAASDDRRYIAAGGGAKNVFIWELPIFAPAVDRAIHAIDPFAAAKKETFERSLPAGPTQFMGTVNGLIDAGHAKEFTNSIGMRLAYVPAGSFTMGTAPAELKDLALPGGYFAGIERQHAVRISNDFYIGVFEVTHKQYQSIMGKSTAKLSEPARPVDNVRWQDAVDFCIRLSRAERQIYRLPTEAEWEYACRAGSTTAYSNGASLPGSDANFQSATGASNGQSVQVGRFAANAFGLYDMHGNIAEWCQDWFAPTPFAESVDPLGPFTGTTRVVRGGSFASTDVECRSAMRATSKGDASPTIGFRVLLELPPKPRIRRSPAEDAVKAENAQIREVFAADFKKKTDADRRQLADTLFETANSTQDNKARKYALLQATAEIAADSGDLDRAFRALAELSRSFPIELLPLQCDAVESASGSTSFKKDVANQSLPLFRCLNQAILADDYASATRLTQIAANTGRSDAAVTERAKSYRAEVVELKREFERIAPSLAKLESDPSNPLANLEAGKFYCVNKGDWRHKLPLLILAKDSPMAKPALAEWLALSPTDLMNAADSWWEVAAKERSKDAARPLHVHCRDLYLRSLPFLQGLDRARVDQRIAAIAAELDK